MYKELIKDMINLPLYYSTELTHVETEVKNLSSQDNPFLVIKYGDVLEWLTKKEIKKEMEGIIP